MENYILQIERKLKTTKNMLRNDIDFSNDFILPFSKVNKISDIKLIFIGQDPTVRRQKSHGNIKVTLRHCWCYHQQYSGEFVCKN